MITEATQVVGATEVAALEHGHHLILISSLHSLHPEVDTQDGIPDGVVVVRAIDTRAVSLHRTAGTDQEPYASK